MIYIKNLTHIHAKDVDSAGGKGASLGDMLNAHIPVPPGFVVLTTAFEQFLSQTHLAREIDTILETVDTEHMDTLEHASKKIHALILGKQMPADITKEIHAHFKTLQCEYVAVRSSATAEDSASDTWAGQLDTYLNTTEADLIHNILQCFASLFSPRAIWYRYEKKIHKHRISMAVVIQHMIQAEKSGTAFSVHPVTQDNRQMIIEAGFGLGEAVVSGSITPDAYIVDKQDKAIQDIRVATQTRGLYLRTTGGNEWRDLGSVGKQQVLREEEILRLAELVIGIEQHYGFSCDIEWAFEKGTFFITQSRPITTLQT